MKNKVLIKLLIPELNTSYDLFIPVNETIGSLKQLIIKSISSLSFGSIDETKEYILLDKETNYIYLNSEVVYDTKIRNATELVLLLRK